MNKPTRLLNASHEVVTYYHAPEFDVSLSDILKPDYWSHVAAKLRPGTRVLIDAPDLSWTATLMCRAASKTEAIMVVVSKSEFDNVEDLPAIPDAFEIKWRGPARKWGVVRKADNEVIRDELMSKPAAQKWLANHVQSMAA